MGIRQDVENLFFGSGVQDLYGHWQSQFPGDGNRFERHGDWPTGEAPDVWAYKIRITDPLNSERLMDRIVTYSTLYSAAEVIADEEADREPPFHSLTPSTGRTCSNWVYSDSLDEFDPHTLDEVLQVAVFGGLLHPQMGWRT